MYRKGRKKGVIRFALTPPEKASAVAVAGSFNDWTPVRMRKQKSGEYVANVETGRGEHEYKFLVDDEWLCDPDTPAWTPNAFGTMNSVARAE